MELDVYVSERRFYVHESSIRELCADFPGEEATLFGALGLNVASRIARHHLVINGEELALVPPATFGPSVRRLDSVSSDRLTVALRRLVYAPAEPGHDDETCILLDSTESVVATCWENGYFTFATGPRSARIMFEETGSLRALRVEIRTSPDTHPDLTMISGRRLFPHSPVLDVGPSTHSAYRRARTRGARLARSALPDVTCIVSEAEKFFQRPDVGSVAFKLFREFLRATTDEVRRLFDRLTEGRAERPA